ncbi:MAG: lipid-binding SYLF domain-containing protein [Sedimentisphaerales bacterium]|nr:lipid-binding SYLF domain-containing protein [Sedimentisphaerales bacterium]
MKKYRFCLPAVLVIIVMIFTISSASAAEDYSSTINVFKQSPQVQPYFKNAYGYAVFPTIGKGGLVIGGAYGKGQVYRGGKVTGITKLMKVSVGFQAGGQAFSQMIFFQDKRAYDEFTSGQFAFDAQASAVAITAGVQAQAGSTGATAGASAGPKTGAHAETSYYKGMAIFVHAKGGLMYEAAIAGQKFSFEPL